jgi:hypothetical protein
VQGIEDFLAGFVLLQIERDDVDAPGRLGDFFQQATTVFGGAGENRLGCRERLKSDGIGLAKGRFRRTRELTPWIRSGLPTARSVGMIKRFFSCRSKACPRRRFH